MLKGVIFKAKQVVRGGVALTQSMLETERRSPDEIAALNWARRLELLESAAKCPFYKKRFADIGLSVGDVKSEKDWERIPPLTRQDVQENLEGLVGEGVDRSTLAVTSTGGSTGQPLRLYRPRKTPMDAFAVRMLGWWGVNMWDNSCYIFRHGYSGWRKVANDLMWWPTKRAFLNAGNMNDAQCEAFYRRICTIHPKLLVGYVGAVSCFAEFLLKHDLRLPFALKAAWTTAAPLPETVRANLQNVFCCPVYSQYGCCECGHLAAECANRNGMHIHSDWRHVEIVDDLGLSRPVGEAGKVLITDMYARSVPLIRYALGDNGRLLSRTCGCGSNLPMMAPVKGRVSEAFPMPDGGSLSGDYLTTIFDRYPDSVRGFRVHQNRDYSILVEYVPRDREVLKVALVDVRRNLETLSKGLVTINLNAVEAIPHDRGKTRYVTSDVEKNV